MKNHNYHDLGADTMAHPMTPTGPTRDNIGQALTAESARLRHPMTRSDPTHCPGCTGWIEPEYLQREPCPGLAALPTTPAPSLREAITSALNELGVPTDDYPAPVANAVAILRAALAALPTTPAPTCHPSGKPCDLCAIPTTNTTP